MLNIVKYNENNKKFLPGGLNQWVSESVGQLVSWSVRQKIRRVEDKTKLQITKYKLQTNHKLQCPKLQTKKQKGAWSLVSKVGMVSDLRRLKASIPVLHTSPNVLYDIGPFAAFSADSVHLKKPSRWPKALTGSPCHGAPGRRGQIVNKE
jgi:hypothetical protein